MIDIKYPYRCRATGIRGWIPLEKRVTKDYRIQLCLSRAVKDCDTKFPAFSQPTDLPDFGKIYLVEKNPNYVKPDPSWIATVVNDAVIFLPVFGPGSTKSKKARTKQPVIKRNKS